MRVTHAARANNADAFVSAAVRSPANSSSPESRVRASTTEKMVNRFPDASATSRARFASDFPMPFPARTFRPPRHHLRAWSPPPSS